MIEDEDVKIWTGGADEDGDVKIWGGARAAEAADDYSPSGDDRSEFQSSRSVDYDSEEAAAPPRRSRRRKSGGRKRHENELSVLSVCAVILSSALLIAAMFFPEEGWPRIVCFAAAALAVGVGLLLDAITELLDGEFLNGSLIMSAAAIASFCLGYYPEAVLILLLYKVEVLFTAFAVERSGRAFDKLRTIRADSANVETPEGVLTVSPEYVNDGDVLVVAPGETIAMDGTVIEGITSLDTAAVTGDPEPRDVSVGSPVYSGTLNLTGLIRVRVEGSYEESTAYRITRIAEASAERKSNYERFADGFGRVFTPVALASALLLAVLPPLFDGLWTQWIGRGVILLTVSCSGALSLSVPMAFMGGIGRAVRQGILVKGTDTLERLASANTMVFDKTGTITDGRYAVTDVSPVGMSERKLLTIASTVERDSVHPIARCLREASAPLKIDEALLRTEEIPGRGVSAFVGDRHIFAGNAALLEEHGVSCQVPERSGAAVHIALDGRYCGHILVADRLREGAFDVLESLRVLGVRKLVMLTGDVLSAARPLASKLNFDMLRAELRPEEKLSALEYLIKNRGDSAAVAFVGDSINDAPCLIRADVGLAIGALGRYEALDAADILLMDDDIKALPTAVRIARLSRTVARENVWAALAVKLGVILLGAGGLIPLAAAVSCDAGIMIAALLNSMRAHFIKKY